MTGSVQNQPIGISILDLDSIMFRFQRPKAKVAEDRLTACFNMKLMCFSIYDVNCCAFPREITAPSSWMNKQRLLLIDQTERSAKYAKAITPQMKKIADQRSTASIF